MAMSTIAAATAGGVIINLWSEGLLRVGSLVFQRMLRIKNIQQAVQGVVQQDLVVRTAIADLETYLGSREGILTEKIHKFIRDLEKSGVVTVMIEEALLDARSETTKLAFIELYHTTSEESSEAEELYSKISIAIGETARALLKDKSLAALINAGRKKIEQRLARIEDFLSVAELHARDDKGLDAKKIEDTLGKICKGLQIHYRTLRVETDSGAKPVDINKIYMPSRLRYMNSFSAQIEMMNISKNRENGHYFFHGRVEQFPYSEFQSEFNRCVVLGDPGGGKSTLCQNLCYNLAKNSFLEIQHGAREEFQPSIQKVPLRIVLKGFERARHSDPQLDILTYLKRDLVNYVNATYSEISEAVDHVLHFGSAVIIFDGLDEILETARRREFVDLVVGFVDKYPLCPSVITSRIVGYDEAPLPDDFDKVVLAKFNDSEVKAYVEKFLKIIGGMSAPESVKMADLFLTQTASNAHDLRQNPLMLGLMSWLFHMKGDVPSNRPEIYKECALLMFDKWDGKRGIKARKTNDFDLLNLFGFLAANIYGDSELEAGVKKDWLLRIIRQFFKAQYEGEPRALESAREIVDFITGRAWLMSDIGNGVYGFTHRTFLEYFFARNVAEQYDGVAKVFRSLKPKIVRSERDVVNHLTLQVSVDKNLRKITEAIRLLEVWSSRPPKSVKHALALFHFAAKSLEYLPGPEGEIRKLVRKIVKFVLSKNVPANAAVLIIGQCCFGARERQSICRKVVKEVLVEAIAAGDSDQFIRASKIVSRPLISFGFEFDLDLLPEDVRHEVLREVRDAVMNRKDVDQLAGLLALEWYSSGGKDFIRNHGLQAIFTDPRSTNRRSDLSLAHILVASLVFDKNEHSIDLDGGCIADVISSVSSHFPDDLPILISKSKLVNPSPSAGQAWLDNVLERISVGPDFDDKNINGLLLILLCLGDIRGKRGAVNLRMRRVMENYKSLGSKFDLRLEALVLDQRPIIQVGNL